MESEYPWASCNTPLEKAGQDKKACKEIGKEKFERQTDRQILTQSWHPSKVDDMA